MFCVVAPGSGKSTFFLQVLRAYPEDKACYDEELMKMNKYIAYDVLEGCISGNFVYALFGFAV